jgi:filamentous hemagglutinin family protein
LRTLTTVASLLLLGAVLPAGAQVVLDGSLGSSGNVPLLGGEYAITETLGRYSNNGESLFHSFGGAVEAGKSGFDIGAGETAHFSASSGAPERVIARVTSGFRSQINGRIRSSIAGADVFLLNASGISLADGAVLDLQGSFYTSTADVLRFDQGPDLLVADPTTDPSLSNAAPAAFGFTSDSPALIEVARTNRLSVPAGETLSIVGGDVFVTGRPGFGVPDVISLPGASLEIAAAAGPVDIPVALSDFDLDAADPATLGLVNISTFAKVRMSGVGETPSGDVLIRGGHFMLASDAQILAQNRADAAPAVGPIDIGVSGDVVLEGNDTQIQSWTFGEARAGDVQLSGDRVLLRDGAGIFLFNGDLSLGHAGEGPDARLVGRVVGLETNAEIFVRGLSTTAASSVRLEATQEIAIGSSAQVISELFPGSSGADGGVLSLDAPRVSLSGAAQLTTRNQGSGAGTAIEIAAQELEVSDGGGVLSRTEATGAGGRIHLDVALLAVTDAGRISSDTTGGAGGSIDIEAERVLVSNAAERDEGTLIEAQNGGSLSVDAAVVELLHGGQILTATSGAIPAGTLAIRNATLVSATGVDAGDTRVNSLPRASGLLSRAGASATADGGLLSVESRVLELNDGAQLSSSTSGAGNAGSIVLDVEERISVRGGVSGASLISASVLPASPPAAGGGGQITIETDQLELRDGGQITTSTFGVGAAGSVEVNARTIEISGTSRGGDNNSGFFSRSGAAGNGGVVELHATESISLSDEARISTSSSAGGLAGDILVDAGEQLRIEDSLITTEAGVSAGGNVKITAQELVYLNDSAIQTLVRSGSGGGGDVTIDPVNTVLNNSNITASAIGGAGGNILIVTDFYFQSGASFLNASSRDDVDGTIEVVAPDTATVSSLASLPTDYLDASSRLERDCSARTRRAGSFVVRARAAALAPPDALLPAPLPLASGNTCPPAEVTP